ncbi:guanine nucleotide-binding protein-like 1 [Cimex lectularius]|uniref:Guanine nucleotide-binding protein-like 1 n=1 Tax=Cimex lectularius TaxID=79782 RepID=A0A8I6S9C0_CIMLE|nr:guanine nucleotide-binding protein-like 1 [Cimex lectularius]
MLLMAPQRKKPFSGKAKKEQLKAKKQGKRMPSLVMSRSSDDDEPAVQRINRQPTKGPGKSNVNRFNLQFRKDSEAEVKKGKEEATKSLVPVKPEELEIEAEKYFPPDLKFPTRPPWDFSMSKEELNAIENRHFSEYLKNVEEKFRDENLSYFELNLETWRQLWRVLEMSDILLIIVDIRYPALMFPPYLYDYITKELNKSIILVLNKIDLALPSVTVAWKNYFKTKYPKMEIVTFTSFPSYNLLQCSSVKSLGLQVRRRKVKMRMAAEGAQKLYESCKNIIKDEVDISSWNEKIKEEMNLEYDDQVEIGETINLKSQDTNFYEFKKFEGGMVTIGCIGQPNVGKSSLLNALMGKKVVSVSRTPGHTKHFQTIFLTSNVRLCDCPGLVFPSRVPKVLQVLMGSYPIAQLREPYTSIKYLAERIDLVKMLKLEHPTNDDEWSAIDICDGWALKRKFYTARTARLDTYRAANNILRITLDGRIILCLLPPGYVAEKEKWESHPEVESVDWIMAREQNIEENSDLSTEDEESEDGEKDFRARRIFAGTSKSRIEEEKDDDGDDEEEESDDFTTGNKFAALHDA